MAKPFNLRYVNEIAGAFVLGAVVLCIGAIFVVGRAQRWFTPVRTMTLVLPAEGSLGLERGASVMVLGTSAGTVNDITVSEDGRMLATIDVRADFMRFIRANSIAIIRRTFGVGDAYVEISRGTGPALPTFQPAIKAIADAGPTQAVEQLTTAVREEVVPTLRELRVSLLEYRKLAASLQDPNGALQASLVHFQSIAADMDKGDGLAGRLLRDPGMADKAQALLDRLNSSAEQTQQLIAELRQTSARLPKIADSADTQLRELTALTAQTRETLQQAQGVLKNIQSSTTQLPETMKAVDQTAQDLPALLLQANETLRQTQRLAEAMQRNWLLGSSVSPDSPARLRPSQAGGQ
jgi:phospholipid/cholesterol/gamma-HCH transport system substrate-binding protein